MRLIQPALQIAHQLSMPPSLLPAPQVHTQQHFTLLHQRATARDELRSPYQESCTRITCTGQTICLPPGTYKAMADINVNVNGVTISAPDGATIMYGNPSGLQFFIRYEI